MPKVLICASSLTHIRNFHLPYLEFFKKQGFEVHVAVPGDGFLDFTDVIHQLPLAKRLISVKNFLAIIKVRRIIKTELYDLILVHTTLAAFVVRFGVLFAGWNRPKLINTVHGYFFWDGCSFLRRMVYYFPERMLRSVTDCIITMNEEDYLAAKHLVKKGGHVFKVHGMGVDAARFKPASNEAKLRARNELDISEDAFVLIYAAEFSRRKNHIELIKAISEVSKEVPETILLLCGTGVLELKIRREVEKLKLTDNVRFLGWCSHMENIYKACDMAVSSSRCEGLPFNIVEAQMCALPVVASRIRGHTDLIEDGVTGWMYTPGNSHQMAVTLIGAVENLYGVNNLVAERRKKVAKYSLNAAFYENINVYLHMLRMPKITIQ